MTTQFLYFFLSLYLSYPMFQRAIAAGPEGNKQIPTQIRRRWRWCCQGQDQGESFKTCSRNKHRNHHRPEKHTTRKHWGPTHTKPAGTKMVRRPHRCFFHVGMIMVRLNLARKQCFLALCLPSSWYFFESISILSMPFCSRLGRDASAHWL